MTSTVVKNIVISGTNMWNPGDDFVRDGVIRILRELFAGYQLNFLFYNFNQDFFPQSKFSGITNMASKGDLDRYRDFIDAVVIAGLSAGTEIKDLYTWIIQNKLYDRVYLIGAGYENSYVERYISEEPEATIFKNARIITGRTRKTPQFIPKLNLPYHYINCPALLSVPTVKHVPPGKKISRIGLSLQLPHDRGIPNHCCSQTMYELGVKILLSLKKKYELEVITHHKSEYFHFINLLKGQDIPVIFSSFYHDLFDIYPRYDLVVTTRLHSSLFANGFGIPGIIINDTDRHTHCLEGFPHSVWVNSIESFAKELQKVSCVDLQKMALEADSFKKNLLNRYLEVLREPFGMPSSTRPHYSSEPNQAALPSNIGCSEIKQQALENLSQLSPSLYLNLKKFTKKPVSSLKLPVSAFLAQDIQKPVTISHDLPIHFFTIVLNGEPFIRYHIEVLKQLPFKWHWHIVEGVADLKHDTAWSLQFGGRITDELHKNGLSNDGTTEYLDELVKQFPENITIYRKPKGIFWDGKLEMVNAPIKNINEECLLWQVDSDELWTRDQLIVARQMFMENSTKSAAYYYCHYFVGENLVTTTRNTYGNNTGYEWLRTWRFKPGMRWTAHEPPRLSRKLSSGEWEDIAKTALFTHSETESRKLVFQHYAYATEKQLRFKEIYFGYKDAVQQWKLLQEVQQFPILLRDYFAWVKNGAQVNTIQLQNITPIAWKDNNNQWRFGSFQSTSAQQITLPSNDYKKILFVRTDSIGDNLLAASMLPHIQKKYENAKITVLCQKYISEVYEACPFVDNIVAFDRQRAYQDEQYRYSIVQRLRALNADIAMNSVYSRELLTDLFAIDGGAKERIAFNGNLCNIPAEIRDKHNQFYTRLLPSVGEHKPELERHRDFLKGLGIDVPSLQPIIWTTSEDDKFADDFFTSNNLRPEKTIALFAGAQAEVRLYQHYGDALFQICKDNQFTIIAFGIGNEHTINQYNLDATGVRAINLCGKATLRQTAAVLKRCRLAVGAETGTAHMACAVGTPNVILLGGGHFGRFMPYSPLTSLACLSLECYGCNWQCKYQTTHCIKDILPEVIAEAVRQTLKRRTENPRVFVQGSSLWNQQAGQPKWKTFDAFLTIGAVEIIPVGEIPPGIHENWQGEDLFAKGNIEGALSAFTKAIETSPNFATAHNNLGVLYWQTGEVQKAVEHFVKALEIDPNDRDTILNCGELFKSLEKIEDARNIYASYLQKNPNDEEVARALADLQDRRVIEMNEEDEKYLVSAIVSTYNSERFIRGCLEDLETQTIADRLEIVVVNSGSEQNEEDIVKEFQQRYKNIKYIKTKKRETVYQAWNRGIKAASGKYITNANTDDRHREDAFERMAEVLDARPDVALVYANVIVTKHENETFDKCTPAGSCRWLDWDRQYLLEGKCFIGPQPMWRRSSHDEYGYFDASFVTSGDYEFWLRLAQTSNFHHISDFLGLYLRSPNSIESSNLEIQKTENEKILRMYREADDSGDMIRRFYSDDDEQLIRIHNQRGEELFNAGKFKSAKIIFEQILSKNPNLIEPLNNLGVIAFQQGELDQAASCFARALETDPNYFESIENLGKCAEAQKDYLKAAEWFERALKLKPDEISLLNSLGNCLIQLEDSASAREIYEKSLRLDSSQESIETILREVGLSYR